MSLLRRIVTFSTLPRPPTTSVLADLLSALINPEPGRCSQPTAHSNGCLFRSRTRRVSQNAHIRNNMMTRSTPLAISYSHKYDTITTRTLPAQPTGHNTLHESTTEYQGTVPYSMYIIHEQMRQDCATYG